MMKMFKREKIIDFFFMREKIRKTSFQLNISMNIHQTLLFKGFTHKKTTQKNFSCQNVRVENKYC